MIKQLWADLSRARSWRVLVPAAVVLAGGAGIAVAAIPSKINGVITSCYQLKQNTRGPAGDLRVIDAQAGGKCKKGEKRLTFNQRGPAGASGKPGPQGAKGDTGPQGELAPGAVGPDHFSLIYSRVKTVKLNPSWPTVQGAQVRCDAGDMVLTGGAYLSGNDWALTGTGSLGTEGWQAVASGGGSGELVVDAKCLSAPGG